MADLRGQRWDHLMEDISPSHTAYWRLARCLKSETVASMPPLISSNGQTAFDDKEKAECLADSLELQCSPSSQPTDPVHLQKVDDEVRRKTTLPPTGDPLPPSSIKEVKEIIRDLRLRKAPGADGISNQILKALPSPLLYLIVAIFNALLDSCSFPDAWKEAHVIGIPKIGKPTNLASSYRPISLLSSLGKIYERIVLNRIKDNIQSLNLLPNEQFGFRAKHSCVQQVHRFTEHVLERFQENPKNRVGALFFDVAKAFDKVWHNGLLYKLYTLEVPDRLVHIIQAYLSNRTFRYRVEGTLSNSRPIRAGVPQGSVLSPTLYTLYTSDIPKTNKVETALFADDTTLYASNTNVSRVHIRLQAAANALSDWFRTWRIDVNPEKSKAVLFAKYPVSKRKVSSKFSSISLFGKPVPWVSEVKYLGVTLDNRLSFTKHIRNVRNKAAFVSGRLYYLTNKTNKMSLRHKLLLYKTCIRPIMSYASVVFAHVPKQRLKPLQVIQNRFMRRATGAPYYMRNADLHRDLNLPTLAALFKEISTRYFAKLKDHPNPLVAALGNYTPALNDPPDKRRPKNVLIDEDDLITRHNNAFADTTPVHITIQTTQTAHMSHTHRAVPRRTRGHRFTPYTRITRVQRRF